MQSKLNWGYMSTSLVLCLITTLPQLRSLHTAPEGIGSFMGIMFWPFVIAFIVRGRKHDWRGFSQWFFWVTLFCVGAQGYRHEATVRDIVREASGKQSVPSGETSAEQKARALMTQALALRKENRELDKSFANTFVGQHLLQPESLSSAEVAAKSLADLERYCTAVDDIAGRVQPILLEAAEMGANSEDKTPITAEYDAARHWCSTSEELYRYASDPSQNVHVKGGMVHIVGPQGYNDRMSAVNEATGKLKVAMEAFEQHEKKVAAQLEQKYGVVPSDLGE
jgi:hypothetical protein